MAIDISDGPSPLPNIEMPNTPPLRSETNDINPLPNEVRD